MYKAKVLIVDDSKLIRDLLSSIFTNDPRLELVGAAKDPYEARQMIKDTNPDVLTLDVEMPKMNGITFLKNLMKLRPMPVVMISTLTSEGSGITMQALELGAVDFIEKPHDLSSNLDEYSQTIIDKVLVAASVSKLKLQHFQRRLQEGGEAAPRTLPSMKPAATEAQKKARPAETFVAIGGSTGGLEALRELLSQIRFRGDEAIVVCLHLPGTFTKSYANRLDGILPLRVKEAEQDEWVMEGTIYIAPGNYHLAVNRRAAGYQCVIDDGPKVNMHKPSVEVLLKSVAENAVNTAAGIILTGMGNDGAQGLLAMRQQGARTFIQDEASSVVWGMPGAAFEAGAVEQVDVQNLRRLAQSVQNFFS